MIENQADTRIVENTATAAISSLFNDSYEWPPGTVTRNQILQTDSNRIGTLDSAASTSGESSSTRNPGNDRARTQVATVDNWISELGFPSLTLSSEDQIALTDLLPISSESSVEADGDDYDTNDSFEFVSFTQPSPPTEPFNETELANFYRGLPARFGSNGALSRTELNNALLNPSLSIQEVGALSALRRFALQQPGQRISAARMTEITRALEARAAGGAMPESQRLLASELQNGTRNWTDRAERLNMNLYANQTNPRASIVPEAAVQPRGVPNCHFISAISSMAAVNPAQLQNMIRENRDGTYTVTFPDMDPITVNAPTRGELLMYYDNTDHGTWPAVLTAAYGRYWTPRGTLNIEGSNGSIRNDGLRTLTGGGIDTDDNGFTGYSTMNTSLTDAFRARRPVTAHLANEVGSNFGLTDNREDRTGLRTGHEYSVIAFTPNNANPSQAQITLRDPHGSVSWFNGRPPAGVTDLGNGRFRMSLREFNRSFNSLSYAEASPRQQ